MPPKKGASGKKESDGKDDKGGDIQGLLLEKDLEIATLNDKLLRLEKRSQSLANLTEKQQIATKEMEEKLRDVISCLTSDVKAKELKINDLELALRDLKAESTRAIDALTKDLNELKNTHKFVTEDLRLQLANAHVQLRDIDDFRAKKMAIEQEIAGLKETIEKEKKEHQDAMSDVERAALQEKERLRKEMAVRIEETKMQMLQQMDEQLHAKTKRTMVENEQLGKELGYHIRQTELLLQKNEKLVQENIELHRQVLLAKEVEDDLARRNRMNQKTIRILLYKLRERHHATKAGKITELEEMKRFLGRQEKLRSSHCVDNVELDQIKGCIQESTRVVELVSSAEDAMKFLYTCLEDIDVEKMSSISDHQTGFGLGKFSRLSVEERPCLPRSLDGFSSQERKEFLMHLLRTAVSLRALSQNDITRGQSEELCYQVSHGFASTQGKTAVSLDDILKLPVEGLHIDETVMNRVQSNIKSISSGAQTETMDLEERLALEIKDRLRACSSSGAGA